MTHSPGTASPDRPAVPSTRSAPAPRGESTPTRPGGDVSGTAGAPTGAEAPPPRSRRIARLVVLTLVTLAIGMLVVGAVGAVVEGGASDVHFFHDVTHFVWIVLLFWLPYMLQWHRPRQKVALWQAEAIGAAVLLAGGLSAGVDDPSFYVGFSLIALLVAVTHPARARLLRGGAGLSPVLMPLALLAAVPASLYAVEQLELQRSAALDPHGVLIHYAGQALAVLFAVVLALVAALRTPGWQWAAGLAAASGVVLGGASLLDPGQAGAWSVPTSVGVLALSLAYAAAAVWEHRRG